MPCRRSGADTIWRTVLRGFSEANGSWNTICMSRRSGWRDFRFAVVMSWPSKRICPALGSSSLIRVRASVVLPQPDSPTSPTVSPSCRVKLTSSTALTLATSRRNTMPSRTGKCWRRWST
jgi:hypothetical protein